MDKSLQISLPIPIDDVSILNLVRSSQSQSYVLMIQKFLEIKWRLKLFMLFNGDLDYFIVFDGEDYVLKDCDLSFILESLADDNDDKSNFINFGFSDVDVDYEFLHIYVKDNLSDFQDSLTILCYPIVDDNFMSILRHCIKNDIDVVVCSGVNSSLNFEIIQKIFNCSGIKLYSEVNISCLKIGKQ